MKMHLIEIDEKIWSHLQKNAEPFVDTPNSVLNRLLFGEVEKKRKTQPSFQYQPSAFRVCPNHWSRFLKLFMR